MQKNNKAAGLDNICNEMFKCANYNVTNLIQTIFNNILLAGTYPKSWNKGYVSAIHKGKCTSDPNNYRCLTINSHFSKLFNSILNIRLNDYLIKNNIIDKCQIGFQKEKRTADHIYTLSTLVQKYTKLHKKKLYACFIDLRKAFDKVWHLGLFYKLKKIGVGTNFYHVIKSMYENNEICVKFEDQITDFFMPNVGVKQGDNLSSTLFNIYVNNLASQFNNTRDPVTIGNSKISCLLYADDLVLLSETPIGLQNSLNIVSNYCQLWKLEINHEKSKILIFELKKSKCQHTFCIENTILERVYQYKYLGIVFSYTGNQTQAKEDLYLRSQKAYFKLRKPLGVDYIKPKLYLDIFDKTVVPILTYGSEVWTGFNQNTKRYKEFKSPNYLYEEFVGEKLHTKLSKILLGVNSKTSNAACRAELGRYPIMINAITNMMAYRSRLEKLTTNDLVKDSLNDDILLDSYGLSNWYSCTNEILRITNNNQTLLLKSNKLVRKTITKGLRSSYDSFFSDNLFNDTRSDENEKNKLRTFRKFKNTIKYEPYLNLNMKKETINYYSQFRLSAHKLQIELARHIKVPKEQRNHQKLLVRKCKCCNSNNNEDELHFMMECHAYRNEREAFLNDIYDMCMNASNLSSENLFIWLLSNEDVNIMTKTIKFVHKCFQIKKNNAQQT